MYVFSKLYVAQYFVPTKRGSACDKPKGISLERNSYAQQVSSTTVHKYDLPIICIQNVIHALVQIMVRYVRKLIVVSYEIQGPDSAGFWYSYSHLHFLLNATKFMCGDLLKNIPGQPSIRGSS